MRAVIIGGGKGCVAILDLATGAFLREFTLDVQQVVDLDPEARGMLRAVELGIPTGDDFVAAMSTEGLELVIELTGNEAVLEKAYDLLPHGVRLIDHTMAHVFWELANAQQEQEWHLVEITKLEEEDGPLEVGACAQVEIDDGVVEEIETERAEECDN